MLNSLKSLKAALSLLAIFACLGAPALGQDAADRNSIAAVASAASGVRWAVSVPHAGTTLTVVAPDGEVFRKEFKAGVAPSFDLTDAQGARLPDGQYVYELRLTPVLTAAAKKELAASRERGNSDAVGRDLRRRGLLPAQPLVQSGAFAVIDGAVVVGGAEEGRRPVDPAPVSRRAAPAPQGDTAEGFRLPAVSIIPARATRGDGLRALRAAFRANVIADDLIVQGSTCVGLDCAATESFGFDTIRLKENNTRIKFEDTSASAGFASNDWQLTANDSASGGANKFSVEDVTGAKVPFTLRAGAPNNSFFVDSAGKVGLRTAAPGLDLHVITGNTPAFRLDQDSTGGFTAQTWDIGANEANFFVRDLTGGSRLPFRIRPGAPTSSIDITASGNVGIGTTSPSAKLHVAGALFADSNAGFGGKVFAVGNGGAANDSFASFGGLFSAGSGEVGLQLGRSGLTSGAAVIQGVKEGTGTNTLTLQPAGGRVGIGTTAPDQLLSVNGDASKTGGGSWQTFSDERLKHIKGAYRAGLSAVMRLQPLRYEYRGDNPLGLTSDGEHVGFGAQALRKVIPEAVTRGESGYLLVNNDPVMWAMLNAIKEQQQQIEELRTEVRRLRAARRPAARRR
ncbi:MAG: tail fiber domain-containing protein [Pyrinomonadaceae bacterium]